MAIWKDSLSSRPTITPASEPLDPARFDAPPKTDAAPAPSTTPAVRLEVPPARKESLIASDITIEGKIEGGGSVRIAGRFKGDVSIHGDLTIEAGAKLTGSVRADKVTIGGELEGNVEVASRVDLLQTGVLIGDLKAGSLTVAPGARMRGQVEFGWEDGKAPKPGKAANGYGAERTATS